jgi:hypothetical protein
MIGDGLREFIAAHQYEYVDLGNDCYRLRFTGKNADYTMFARSTEEPGQLMVFTYCPVKVPDDRRSMVADYINRVNYGLIIGCLEMDPDDGEVRTRSSAPVGPGEPGPSVLGPLFDSSFYRIDNWLPGLLRVAFGADDPATGYARVLEALRSEQTPLEAAEDSEAAADPGLELTAIEQEVAQLLADGDCDQESPPPSI